MIILKTMGEKLEYYAPSILRIGIALVYLWFGTNQVMNPNLWTGFLPDFIAGIAENTVLTVLIIGIFHSLLGFLLLIGLMTRYIALLLVIHTIIMITGSGFNSTGVRDFGLLIGTLTIAMMRNDPLRLDNRVRFGKKKDPISFD